ncbi:MAG TPA: anti-sigma factor domain-containing protein [Firmicutes bacterium]|nr:anti-sigma factor domain-containing protein [Bacillota bacterium]
MQVKGIVVEVHETSVVVVTPEGEFLELPRRGCVRLGQAVLLGRERNLFPELSRTLAAIAAALIIAIGLARVEVPVETLRPPATAAPAVGQTALLAEHVERPTYYVTLDPQPGIELAVGAGDRITAVTRLDGSETEPAAKADGLVGLRVGEGLAKLVREAQDKGELRPPSGQVLFLTVAADGDSEERQELALRLADYVKETLPDSGPEAVQVVALSGGLNVRAAARAANLSVGSYLAFLKAKAEGLALTAADVRTKGVQLAIKEAGGHWRELLAGDRKVAAGDLVQPAEAKPLPEEGAPGTNSPR